MKITSPVFEQGAKMPSKYTCDGQSINPPLEIRAVPDGAKSLVLIMDDPDVPTFVRKDQMWVHWVLFNMPATTKSIAEDSVPPGVLGKTTGGELGYVGACPPDREHRYFFKLYALDTLLDLPAGATKEEVEKKMEGHILAKAELMARYKRNA